MATHSSVLALENPRDSGAWWAAVSGVAQSLTRLKRLSSSSSSTVFPVPRKGPKHREHLLFVDILITAILTNVL